MKITCISDLHGYYPDLEGGDLLIVAGDLTINDTYGEYLRFFHWIANTKYRKRIVIAGNHDNLAQIDPNPLRIPNGDFEYLEDSGTEFECLKIWGSPWTAAFIGMNPHCMAFTMPFGCDTDDWLAEKWDLIPADIDILVTHSPPYSILDKTRRNENVGSKSLAKKLNWDGGLKLHVFGHIHEGYGEEKGTNGIFSYHYINASHVNEEYEPVNKPITINL